MNTDDGKIRKPLTEKQKSDSLLELAAGQADEIASLRVERDEALARVEELRGALAKARRLELECRTDVGFAPSILCDGSQCHPCEVMHAIDSALSTPNPQALRRLRAKILREAMDVVRGPMNRCLGDVSRGDVYMALTGVFDKLRALADAAEKEKP